MTKAAGYIRVSTAGQAEHGLRLEIQRDAITTYCRTHGLELVTIYEDAGVSGANGITGRRGWLLLAEALEGREFETVVVAKLDRLARDLMLQETMLANVQKQGGKLVSIQEPDLCSDDPSRTFFRQVAGAMSQYEKSIIVGRLKHGRNKKTKQGGYAGGWLPYGYAVDGQGREAVPMVDEAAAATVKRIFAEYAKGSSMKRLADAFNAEGVPTARGGRWAQATVQTILANDFYAGDQADGRQGHEAIITQRQFNACQRRMSEACRRPAA
jgi:site-specific DNA recombinase